jgi:hypothetical protein
MSKEKLQEVTVKEKPLLDGMMYDAALKGKGLITQATRNDFLELFSVKGAFVIGELLDFNEVKTTAKRGLNAGKEQLSHYYNINVETTNLKGIAKGELRTISAPGLLHFFIQQKLDEGIKFPCRVGICYLGKNKDGFHQVSCSWPENGAKK